ncbi:MAG TPA: O-antigen ligase family protein, partial [Candidatus Wallbacteria bacterium]|nr:O-antigen ligase family protein [Candidatus Wallbacteria bacterium]
MLNFKTFTYLYISFVFFLQLLYNGGLTDFTNVPAFFSITLLYLAVLFFFPKWSVEPKSLSVVRISIINVIILASLTLFSECVQIGFIEISKYLSAILLFMTLYTVISSREDFHEFIKIFTGFIELYVYMAMAFYFYSKYVMGVYFSGICFTLVYPYYHATLVIASVPFTIFLYFSAKNAGSRMHYLAFFLIQCLNVFLTSSRVAQLNLIMIVMFMVLWGLKSPDAKGASRKLLACFLIMTIFGAVFTTDAFVRIFKSFQVNENYDIQSEDGRLQIYRAAVLTFLDHPLKGVGLGQASLFLPKYRTTAMSLVDCHNIILNRLCEGGVVYFLFSAFAFFYILYITYRYSILRFSPAGEEGRLFSMAALASLFSLYFQGLSMPHSFMTILIYMEYIATAACAIALRTAMESNSSRAAVKSPIDFEFAKPLFRYVSLFSFFTALLLCFIIFADNINAFPQWYMNLSFLLIFLIIFLRFNVSAPPAMLKNARENIVIKSFVLALSAAVLFFLFSVFNSGFLCEEGIGALSQNNRAEGLSCLEKSVRDYPNMAALLHLSALYHDIGRYEDAYVAAKKYNEALPYELLGLNNLAACQFKLKKFGACHETLLKLDASMTQNRGSAPLAAFLISSGATFEGVKKFAAAVLENPDFSASRFFSISILGNVELRESFKREFIALIPAYLEKNKNFLNIPANNLAKACYNLYCRGFGRIFTETALKFSDFDNRGFIKNYYFNFLRQPFIFNDGLHFSD